MKTNGQEVYGVIYLITNTVNGKKYVGQTTQNGGFNERYKGNLANTHNEHLKRAINFYGIDKFNITKEFDIAMNQKKLDELEDYYICTFDCIANGYNKRRGGNNRKLSEETKKKISKNHANITGKNNPMYGIHKYGEENPFYGKHHTIEAKKKIGQANKGAKNFKAKKVICITTGIIFDTIAEGANFYNCDYSGISKVCRGKRKFAGNHPQTKGKLQWGYLNN